MGMTPEAFWSMVPRDFYRMYEAHYRKVQENYKLEQWLFAQLQATIANFVPIRSKKGKTYKAKDFMPIEKKKQTTEQMYNMVKMLNMAFGGEDRTTQEKG